MQKDKKKDKKKDKSNSNDDNKKKYTEPIAATIDDFDISKLELTAPKADEKFGGNLQLLGEVKYNDGPLYIQTGWIQLKDRGVPSFHERFYPTEKSRRIIGLPLDKEDKNSKKLLKKIFKPIDDLLESEDMQQKLFPKMKPENLVYNPLVKQPQDKSNDDDEALDKGKDKSDKPKRKKYPYIKAKIDMKYPQKGDGKKKKDEEDGSEDEDKKKKKAEVTKFLRMV